MEIQLPSAVSVGTETDCILFEKYSNIYLK